jgi:serine/threonine protein kinase
VKRCPADGTILSVSAALQPKVSAVESTTPAPMVANDLTTPAKRSVSTSSQPAARAVEATLADGEVETGTTVGEYTITGKLGAGGMGVVYAGVHPLIGKKVAIKVLNAALSSDAGMATRFVQEARSVNQIGHRNIVDIFAFGQLANGRHYFVMELLSGQSLKQRLDRGPMVYPEAFAILLEVCDALVAAHAEGIVHRDLKPDNIYLASSKSGERTVKLLDFGIAKLLRDEGLASTRTGQPMGTPLYMSPEQCLGRAVDARADIYSLGVIMFEIFTGHLPFAGGSYIETVNGHLSTPPPRPSTLSDVPTPLEALILSCLEKDPAKRPQTVADLRGMLTGIAEALGAELPRRMSGVHLPVGSRSTPVSGPMPTGSAPAVPPRRGSSPGVIYAVIALVAAGLVVGVVVFLKPKKSPAAVSAPAEAPSVAIQVLTDQPGADVTINGKHQALKTPGVFNVPRAANMKVRVEKRGFAPYEESLTLAADESARAIDVRLQPLGGPTGKLEARVTGVKKATWLLDGKPAGDGSPTLALASLPAGTHTLRAEASGYQPREESIEVEPQTTRSLEWVLTPMPHGSHKTKSPAPAAATTRPAKPVDDPGAEWPPR